MSENDLPQWWHDKWTNVRIMTITEGYVLARRVNKDPFVMRFADFRNTFKKGKKNV